MMLDAITPDDLMRDTVFVPNVLAKKGEHIITVMQKNEFGKHTEAGKIYLNGDTYSAKDYQGKPIFLYEHKLSNLKERFKQQGKEIREIRHEARMKELRAIRDGITTKNRDIER